MGMLDGKTGEMLIRTVISSLGIDANVLLANLRQFQDWVTNAIQYHDARLGALETQAKECNDKLVRILAILEADSQDTVSSFNLDAYHAAIDGGSVALNGEQHD